MAKDPTQQSELQPREKQAVAHETTRPGPVFRPDVDIVEHEDEFLVMADLPGVDSEHVDVSLEKGVLTISASSASLPDPSWTPLHAEYQVGGYHREFHISDRIDVAQISARVSGGVLELHLPKSQAHRPRQIDVTAG